MKILSIQGGGCFGIGAARILAEAGDLSKFDMFIGTSIGAAICAAIASGTDPKQLPYFFHDEMPKIFKGHWWRKYKAIGPRYNDKELNNALQSLVKGTLDNCKRPTFLTATNLGARELKVFNSLDASDGVWNLWEACRCAVAAETYFAPWKGYGDAGILCNTPDMAGIASASRVLGAYIRDIELCAIGTGFEDNNTKEPKARWTVLQWAFWLLKLMMSGSANGMHIYFAKSLPLKKYERIQFVRKSEWDMDSAEDMLKAELAWEQNIQKGIEIVKNF